MGLFWGTVWRGFLLNAMIYSLLALLITYVAPPDSVPTILCVVGVITFIGSYCAGYYLANKVQEKEEERNARTIDNAVELGMLRAQADTSKRS